MSQEDDETISAYWERVTVHWNEAKITDEVQFKEVFLRGMANLEARSQIIIIMLDEAENKTKTKSIDLKHLRDHSEQLFAVEYAENTVANKLR